MKNLSVVTAPVLFGILHTWGWQLEYHPHIHYIVPGGCFDKESGYWHSSRIDFYVPVAALSKIFKAKFRDEVIKAGLYDQINPVVWTLDWNVNCQPQRIITLYNKVGLIEQWIEFDPQALPKPSNLSLKGRLNPYRLYDIFL